MLYHEMLQNYLPPSIVIPFQDNNGVSACHLLPILLPKGMHREDFMAHMKTYGIQTSIHYPPVHL